MGIGQGARGVQRIFLGGGGSKMERYREVVKRLNELNLQLNSRVKRCNYLHRKAKEYKDVNFEQAQAYVMRIRWHKPKLLTLLEEITRLEDELKSMPREWIV